VNLLHCIARLDTEFELGQNVPLTQIVEPTPELALAVGAYSGRVECRPRLLTLGVAGSPPTSLRVGGKYRHIRPRNPTT